MFYKSLNSFSFLGGRAYLRAARLVNGGRGSDEPERPTDARPCLFRCACTPAARQSLALQPIALAMGFLLVFLGLLEQVINYTFLGGKER